MFRDSPLLYTTSRHAPSNDFQRNWYSGTTGSTRGAGAVLRWRTVDLFWGSYEWVPFTNKLVTPASVSLTAK